MEAVSLTAEQTAQRDSVVTCAAAAISDLMVCIERITSRDLEDEERTLIHTAAIRAYDLGGAILQAFDPVALRNPDEVLGAVYDVVEGPDAARVRVRAQHGG